MFNQLPNLFLNKIFLTLQNDIDPAGDREQSIRDKQSLVQASPSWGLYSSYSSKIVVIIIIIAMGYNNEDDTDHSTPLTNICFQ